jgi:hypothetical protein
MMLAQPTPGRGPPPPPRGRPCRPAGRPRPGPVRSAPPEGGSRRPARSRSAPHMPARDSARCACATTAPPAGRRSAGRGPGPCGGRVGWLVRRSPHSRSLWLWSGPRAAIAANDLRGENLEAVQAEQPGDGGTTVLTHLGPPLAGRQTSARYARPQVPLGRLWRRQRHLTTLHDEEPRLKIPVEGPVALVRGLCQATSAGSKVTLWPMRSSWRTSRFLYASLC